MTTTVHIHEYNCTTASYTIADVPIGGSLLDDCVLVIGLTGYRSGQHPGQTIRAPGAWSNPAGNVGNAAAGQQFAAGVLASPHVHGGMGPGHRAAIGARTVAAGANYQYMNIYIGQFS